MSKVTWKPYEKELKLLGHQAQFLRYDNFQKRRVDLRAVIISVKVYKKSDKQIKKSPKHIIPIHFDNKGFEFFILISFCIKMTSLIFCQKVYRNMRFHQLYVVFPIPSEINFLTIRISCITLTLMIPALMEPVYFHVTVVILILPVLILILIVITTWAHFNWRFTDKSKIKNFLRL